MANSIMVENALKTAIGTALLNSGAPVYAACVKRGWPEYNLLTSVMQSQQYLVSIFQSQVGSNDIKFKPTWGVLNGSTTAIQTLAATVQNATVPNSITFTGSASATQNIHVFVGRPSVDIYYRTKSTDTPTSVATAVASGMNTLAGVSASATGPTVITAGTTIIQCNIGASLQLVREIRRELKQFRITCWCSSPQQRDLIAPIVEESIGTTTNQWLLLADGSSALMTFVNSYPIDESQKDSSLFRYDIIMSAEYPVYETETATQIGSFNLTENYETLLGTLSGSANSIFG